MALTSIQLYRVRIKEVRKDGWLTFHRSGRWNLYGMLKKYCCERRGKLINLRDYARRPELSKERKTLRVEMHKAYDDKARLSVYVSGGDFGTTSDLCDVNTGESVHAKLISETEMAPFFCAFDVPDDSTWAYMVCECKGSRSVFSALKRDLKKWFGQQNLVVDIDVLTDIEALYEYLEAGSVCESVTVKSARKPKESRAMLRKTRLGGEELDEGATVEVKVKRSPLMFRKLKKGLRAVFKNDRDPRELIAIEGLPDIDELTAVLTNADGVQRTFNLCNPRNTKYRYDVDDQVRTGENGHPIFDSIEAVAYSHIDDVRGQSHRKASLCKLYGIASTRGTLLRINSAPTAGAKVASLAACISVFSSSDRLRQAGRSHGHWVH